MRPSFTAWTPRSARGLARTNHCSDRYGSTVVPHRWQCPTECEIASVRIRRPCASRSRAAAFRASSIVIPRYLPAFSFMMPSESMTWSCGRSWRSPTRKSLGSCAGVIFTQPVPNSGSTMLSSMIGISRSVRGTRTRLPIRPRYCSALGWTAMAVSPMIVSGRVVATTISPDPSTNG